MDKARGALLEIGIQAGVGADILLFTLQTQSPKPSIRCNSPARILMYTLRPRLTSAEGCNFYLFAQFDRSQ
jgi:hypothetical protein